MTGLILPKNVVEKQRKKEKGSSSDSIVQAYESAEDKVLNPEKLPDSIVERLPQPTGWRILVLPYQGTNRTKSGNIHLPDEFVDRERLATVCGYVLKVGSSAYQDEERFGPEPWCKEGDWILIGRYAGSRFKIEGGEVRIINDDEVIGTIHDPSDIVHY